MFRTVGLVTREWFADGVVQVELDLTTAHLMEDDADLRDWRSAVESLRPILQPSHVVVIGASRDGSGPGCRILDHLRASFTGRISVVHPVWPRGRRRRIGRAGSVSSTPCPTWRSSPSRPSAAVGVVDECGRAGVAAAVVISSGFAEQDDAGRQRQDELLATARSHGMRIVGPNCLGVVSTRCGLNATFTAQRFLPGGIAVAAQSGGVGIAIAAEAEQRHAGISAFVSMGNKVDVSSNDLLRLWADDDDTSVALLYLESFGDPVRFARVARAVSRRMPIVALKAGRTEPGRRAARSHTAALATDDVVVDALFAHTGVIRAQDARGAHRRRAAARPPARPGRVEGGAHRQRRRAADPRRRHRRRPSPRRSGAVGGPACDDRRPGPGGRRDGESRRPDLGDGRRPARRRHPGNRGVRRGRRLHRGRRRRRRVERSTGGEHCRMDWTYRLRSPAPEAPRPSFPVYPSAERAAVAVALAAQRARWLSTLEQEPAAPAETASDAAELAIARRSGSQRRHVRRLARAGSRVRARRVRRHPGRTVAVRSIGLGVCAEAATRIGAPCVVKGDVERVLHKRDEGAVVLGIANADAAGAAYGDLVRRFGDRLRGAIVQAQATPGLELLVGVARHPGFGPVVLVGAGGTEAELRNDLAVLVAPVSTAAATRAINGLRLAPLLHGYRGRAPLPVDRVADLVHRVSSDGRRHP